MDYSQIKDLLMAYKCKFHADEFGWVALANALTPHDQLSNRPGVEEVSSLAAPQLLSRDHA